MTYQISHNGQTWASLGRGPAGYHIWPIEEFFARNKHKPAVRERIRRLHPNGCEEGRRIRGWFHRPMSWRCAKRAMQSGQQPKVFRREGGREIWNFWMHGGTPPEFSE